MRFISTLALASALLFASTSAHASSATPGYISQVFAMGNGTVMFTSSGTHTPRPGCQGPSIPSRWAIDGSTPAGQARVAVLLTAYSLRKQVQIEGTGSCSNWADTETVNYLFTMNDL